VLNLLEEEGTLRQVLQDLAPEGITIRIGQENSLAEMKNLSMVTARYEISGRLVGTVGVLGPTRMDYSRVVSVLERITRHLNDSLSGKKHSS
jgi:heat-inducible transcriptional repressor